MMNQEHTSGPADPQHVPHAHAREEAVTTPALLSLSHTQMHTNTNIHTSEGIRFLAESNGFVRARTMR
jgi:hypothetical protein